MAAIVEERTISVAPEIVYNALTQHDGIAQWWIDDLIIRPEEGSLADFRFIKWGGNALQFEIAELDANKKVRWISRQGPPYCSGTIVTWQIEHVRNSTRLVFTHDGFAQADEFFERVREN